MRKTSAVKGIKSVHTSSAKKGMGDYYGSGVKNKMGTMVSGVGVNPLTPKKLKKPPKAVA